MFPEYFTAKDRLQLVAWGFVIEVYLRTTKRYLQPWRLILISHLLIGSFSNGIPLYAITFPPTITLIGRSLGAPFFIFNLM